MFDDFGINAGFVEDLHAQYRQSPQLGRRAVAELLRLARARRVRRPHATPPSRRTANGNGTERQRRARARAASPALAPTAYTNGAAAAATAARDERLAAAAALRAASTSSSTRTACAVTSSRRSIRSARRPRPRPSSSSRTSASREADYDVEFPTVGIGRPPGARDAPRDHRAPLRDVLRVDRRRVHAHRGARGARVAPERDGVDAQPRRARQRRGRPHPQAPHGRRDLRAVRAQELRRREAVLARGRREHDRDARSADRVRGRRTASRRSSSAWPTAAA